MLPENPDVISTGKLNRFLKKPALTWQRILAALLVAVIADGLQILLLPFAWTFIESALEVVAMAATTWLIGFHPLLLPTAVVEIFPVVDAFPTWTACVIAVIALRRREEKLSPPPGKPPVKSD